MFEKLESKGKLESEGINNRDLAESIVDAGCSAHNFDLATLAYKVGYPPCHFVVFRALQHQAAATKDPAEKKRLAQEGIALFKKLESKGKLESERINNRDLAESIVDAGCSARNFDFAKLAYKVGYPPCHFVVFRTLGHQAMVTKDPDERKRLAQEGFTLFKKLESKSIRSLKLVADSIVDARKKLPEFDEGLLFLENLLAEAKYDFIKCPISLGVIDTPLLTLNGIFPRPYERNLLITALKSKNGCEPMLQNKKAIVLTSADVLPLPDGLKDFVETVEDTNGYYAEFVKRKKEYYASLPEVS